MHQVQWGRKIIHLEDWQTFGQLCSIISVSNKALYKMVLSHYINTNHPLKCQYIIKFLVLSPSSWADFGVCNSGLKNTVPHSIYFPWHKEVATSYHLSPFLYGGPRIRRICSLLINPDRLWSVFSRRNTAKPVGSCQDCTSHKWKWFKRKDHRGNIFLTFCIRSSALKSWRSF